MDNLVDADDYSIDPEDAAKYLDLFTWETHLSDFDRWRLYIARSCLKPENEAYFSLTLASTLVSAEFADDLETAGGDPQQRALGSRPNSAATGNLATAR